MGERGGGGTSVLPTTLVFAGGTGGSAGSSLDRPTHFKGLRAVSPILCHTLSFCSTATAWEATWGRGAFDWCGGGCTIFDAGFQVPVVWSNSCTPAGAEADF